MDAAALETWMTRAALPLWRGAGRDPTGAFYERLHPDGRPDVDAPRRVRVQFRQIYVYAAAAAVGLDPGGLAAAERAFERVRETAWGVDGVPGWAHWLHPDGRVLDATRDAYDHAFALLAMAWLHRASPSPRVRAAIDETLAFVDTGMAAGSGGWWERAAPDGATSAPAAARGRRRQNPHMHAFEAMMALYEATGERDFIDRARQIYHLFAARFFRWSDHVVLEYFDDDWRPAPDAEQRLEPGHMAEWVYLLREYERLTGDSVDAVATPLYQKTWALGLDPTGRFLVDELTLEGRATKNTRRLWPQTELLKATLVQYRALGEPTLRERAETILRNLADEYLTGVVAGGWRDAFTLDGAQAAGGVPASTLYHLFAMQLLARDLLTRRSTPLSRPALTSHAARPEKITPVVLAGGRGAGLWPLSRAETPKPFLRLIGDETLLQGALHRVRDPRVFATPWVVCHARHGALAAAQAAEIDAPVRLALEPEPRNSAPAVAAAAALALQEDPDALLLVTPSDHLIREETLFRQLAATAADAAVAGALVAFGVPPTRPETAYGYVKAGAPLGLGGAFAVDRFVEKPDLATARAYVASGSYFWNSGVFLFRAARFLEELARFEPGLAEAATEAAIKSAATAGDAPECRVLAPAAFARCPSISLDYAVMEKTDAAAVYPAALTWSDVDGWDAVAGAAAGDADGNAAAGPVTLLDARRVYARSDGPRVAVVGLEDAIVVAAEDAVLVAAAGAAGRVRDIPQMTLGGSETEGGSEGS